MADISVTIGGDGVALIEMDDAAGRNAMSEPFVETLSDCYRSAVDNPDTRVIILFGMPEIFCSGAPKELLHRVIDGDFLPTDIHLPRFLLDIPLPVIAAMEGHATGGGFALGLCADVVIMARESRYGCNFMNMGLTPGMGTTRLLEYISSPAVAHELLYTGEFRKGAAFASCGGINAVLPRNKVRAHAMDLAFRIAEKPRTALETLKRGLAGERLRLYEEAYALETEMHRIAIAQPGIQQWIEEQYLE